MQFTQSSSMHMVAFQNRESCEVFPGREAMCKHLIRKNKLFSTEEVWNVQLIKTSHPTFLWQQKALNYSQNKRLVFSRFGSGGVHNLRLHIFPIF